MVTGDALAIAKETAPKVGLGTDILDAAGLGEVKKDESAAVAESIETADGFAQVFPEHNTTSSTCCSTRPHCRHDRRRRQRRPRAEKGRLRHRRIRRHRRRPGGRRHRAADPGPSVIIDAIKREPQDLPADEQLRDVPHRRNAAGAAVHDPRDPRLQLLPVTAIMIVMLALLNDGAILSIAYDNVHYPTSPKPGTCAWYSGSPPSWGWSDHRLVRPVLPGRPRLRPRPPTHPDPDVSDAVRRRSPHHLLDPHPRTLLVHPPARILLVAVFGTQAIATLIAVYGLFMTPLGWGWAAACGHTPSPGS